MATRPKRTRADDDDAPLFQPPATAQGTTNPPPARQATDFFRPEDRPRNAIEPDRDLLIPRLTIAQPMSPQLQADSSEYIPSLRAGQIFDRSTNSVFPDGVDVLVAYYAKQWVEWHKDRSKRQIIKNWGMHRPKVGNGTGVTQDDKGRFVTAQGVINETACFYVLNLTAGGKRAFISMTSTQFKTGKGWNTKLYGEEIVDNNGNLDQAPNYWRPWKLTTVRQQNEQGHWFGWVVNNDGTLTKDLPNALQLRDSAHAFMMDCENGLVVGDLSADETMQQDLATSSM